MREKITRGEQADNQTQRFIQSSLQAVEKPPTKIGLKHCVSCEEEIPMARRKAYGNDLCIYCPELKENKY